MKIFIQAFILQILICSIFAKSYDNFSAILSSKSNDAAPSSFLQMQTNTVINPQEGMSLQQKLKEQAKNLIKKRNSKVSSTKVSLFQMNKLRLNQQNKSQTKNLDLQNLITNNAVINHVNTKALQIDDDQVTIGEQSKIKIGKSTITGNDLLGLINYNEMLMKRCGPNLENCMIKDTGDDVYDEQKNLLKSFLQTGETSNKSDDKEKQSQTDEDELFSEIDKLL